MNTTKIILYVCVAAAVSVTAICMAIFEIEDSRATASAIAGCASAGGNYSTDWRGRPHCTTQKKP